MAVRDWLSGNGSGTLTHMGTLGQGMLCLVCAFEELQETYECAKQECDSTIVHCV